MRLISGLMRVLLLDYSHFCQLLQLFMLMSFFRLVQLVCWNISLGFLVALDRFFVAFDTVLKFFFLFASLLRFLTLRSLLFLDYDLDRRPFLLNLSLVRTFLLILLNNNANALFLFPLLILLEPLLPSLKQINLIPLILLKLPFLFLLTDIGLKILKLFLGCPFTLVIHRWLRQGFNRRVPDWYQHVFFLLGLFLLLVDLLLLLLDLLFQRS